MKDPAPENGINWTRWLVIFLLIPVVGCGLFFAGRFIYGLGQRASSRISGVDLTPKATLSAVLKITSTATLTFTPVPTATYYFPPTATATKIPWTSCPGIVITASDTSKGDMLHVLRCSDGFEYDVGPLTKGAYAVSPDDKYLVYCDISGILYAAKIGNSTLTVIQKVNKDFYTFGQDMAPIFELKFNAGNPRVLEIHEKRYDQKLPITMPGWLSQ